MSLDAGSFKQRLEGYGLSDAKRAIVAFSGGLDSTVLLHLLVHIGLEQRLLAVHVNHGLESAADQWERHCRDVCGKLGIRYDSVRVEVRKDSGLGTEAAAREARYAAFAERLEPGDCLLTAHHLDDQGETLILNLMRSSGPLGLAGIPAQRPFGRGRVVRPLLDVPREDLLAYARAQHLEWVEDPSNRDTDLDRNYVRRHVLPALCERWPDAASRLSTSSMLMAEAVSLCDELAARDLEQVGGDPQRIAIDALVRLDDARQRNLIRFCLRRLSIPLPGRRQLESILSSVVPARADAEPLVAWQGGEARRFRDRLFLLPPREDRRVDECHVREAGQRVELGPCGGVLRLVERTGEGLDAALLEATIAVRYREGGETIRIAGSSRKLKKLLQEADILPWMRDRIPLLFAGNKLVAVADLWIDDAARKTPGLAVDWTAHPPIR